ncbi:hypothetical protein [Lysinibacter cavernae]|uniref:hypothetical protein n=1 Tax=Lysinibacter cavernae TaxID=1640652 RepID=UPI003612C3EA
MLKVDGNAQTIVLVPLVSQQIISEEERVTNLPRTIPDEAWANVHGPAVFRNGCLYPDTVENIKRADGSRFHEYPDSTDVDQIHWLSFFKIENYKEWSGAVVLCPREPAYEGVMVRFDEKRAFIDYGYRNPYRDPGTPDWYFFWIGFHSTSVLKKWCRENGLLPSNDLPDTKQGGLGIATGLRGERERQM